MTEVQLPKQIELLVDNLRKQDTAALSLTDVASVTEVLIGTMNVFFKSIDTSIYRECRALSDYITDARKEIASLQPSDLESAHIPRAELELDAIVQQTEEATNTIMEAAEEIMGADTEDPAAYQATTQDAVMRIFEACSFQDITGQRISKVVETLAHIEKRVLELRDLLGVTEADIEEARAGEPQKTGDAALLSGPALDGEGIDQNEVDALMGGMGSAPAVSPAPAPAPTPVAAPEPAPAPPPPPKPAPEPPKAVNPKQLDSMFEEDFDPVADLATKEEEKKKKAEADAKKAAEAEAKKEEVEVDMPTGEEVSQDDIDALFS
tara:strand:+ start:372 stop:1337 length:966 start_codon:yes stop_codon:yes gene_type:complete